MEYRLASPLTNHFLDLHHSFIVLLFQHTRFGINLDNSARNRNSLRKDRSTLPIMLSLELDWYGLILPCAYMLVLGGTFITFSSVYRKRKAGECFPCSKSLCR